MAKRQHGDGGQTQRYVSKRGDVFHYRRRVPKGAESRFEGRTEFVRTLKASSLRAAQSELALVMAEFERRARPTPRKSQAPSTVDPLMPGPRSTGPLDQALAARLARVLLAQMRVMNSGLIGSMELGGAPERAAGYRAASLQERRALARREYPEAWRMSARAMLRSVDVDPADNADFFDLVTRAVGEVRAEHLMESAFELEGETGRVANHSMFGDEAFKGDTKAPQVTTVGQAAARYLSNPLKQISASTLQQYRPRMKVLEEALGTTRAIASITKADCKRVLEDVILHLPSNGTKKYPGLSLKAAIAQGAKDGAPLIGLTTQRLYVEQLKSFFAWAEDDDLVEVSVARKLPMPTGPTAEERDGLPRPSPSAA